MGWYPNAYFVNKIILLSLLYFLWRMEMSRNFRTGINDQKNISDKIFIVWKAILNIPKSVNWFPSGVAHTYAGLAQTLRWKFLKWLVCRPKALTIIVKCFILVVCGSPGYVSVSLLLTIVNFKSTKTLNTFI